jgi:hypothetical protein
MKVHRRSHSGRLAGAKLVGSAHVTAGVSLREEEVMAFDKNIGGHAFPERGGTCLRCEMTWTKFMDSGKPQCTGRKPEKRERMAIDEE